MAKATKPVNPQDVVFAVIHVTKGFFTEENLRDALDTTALVEKDRPLLAAFKKKGKDYDMAARQEEPLWQIMREACRTYVIVRESDESVRLESAFERLKRNLPKGVKLVNAMSGTPAGN